MASATLDVDEDDDVFYDARSEESLSVGPRRRQKDQFHCTSSSITTPSSSPHNAATNPTAATNPKKDPPSSDNSRADAVPGPITSPRLHKSTKSTISCDTCCQLEDSPIPTPRNPSPVGSSSYVASNINSPTSRKASVEYALSRRIPQSPKSPTTPTKRNSDGESSRKNSAHNPQVNETIDIPTTTIANTNSGDLLQVSTLTTETTATSSNNGSPTHHETAATVVSTATAAALPPSSPTITTTAPPTTKPATAASPSPVTISVTTTSAEEAVAGNKANSELSRDSDITGVVASPFKANRDLTPEAALRSPCRPKLSRQDYSCIDSTSEAASTDESHLTKDSRCSSNDRTSITDKIDISNLPLPALPPKKRRSRSRPSLASSAHTLSSSITTPEDNNVKDTSPLSDRTSYQKYAAKRRESLEASTRSFNEKLKARKMHFHSLGQTSAASSSQKPTYLFGENRSSKKTNNEIFLNKSGWVQVNSKRINNENSPGSHNRRSNYLRYDNHHNDAANLKNTIRVIKIDNTGRDKSFYAVPKVSGSKIEELISRNEARRNTSATRGYLKPGYKIVDPQIASILNERPGFLPVKSYFDSESPPPVTPILSPPPAFQDSKAKYERPDTAIRLQITTGNNIKYDPNKVGKGGMVFSRSFEYDTRKTPKDNYVETFSRSFDCNLSDKPPPQRDRSPNFSTLTGCSPNYLTKKESTLNKSRDNSPKYQQNLTTAYMNTSVKEAPPVYSQPRKLEKAKTQFDRSGRSRKAQFSSRVQSASGMVVPPSIANMSRFRSFDTNISQRLNSCDSGARSDLSNDELDNEEDESTEFLTTNYHNISPYKQQRQRSLTPDRNDSHSSSSSLRKQRSITPESRSLTPEDRRKKGSQGSLIGSRQNSGSRSNTLERNKKYEDKSRSASRSSSSSSYSGREHDGQQTSTPHRRSNARNAKAAEDHRIRRSRSLQLTERSPNRSHKIMVCVGQPIPPNQPPIYHQSSLRSSQNSAFPPVIRTTTNPQQILVTNANSNRNTRSSEVDKSRSFDFDYGTYSNQNVPSRLDFVDKSRSFDEDYRETSNNNGNASINMRYLQTTDVPGLRKMRKTSPVPSPQSSGTGSSTTLGPRQTSPQNYGTRLCDHELTYDMLRRSLDRSPIMDFSRDYDIPASMKNRETINAGGNSELNFLSSSERIYDHPTTKRPNQSPSDSNYSLDRLHNSRDSITPDSANEFKSIVTSDDRLRSEYLYRQQQQQRSHQGTNRGSSCTANTCDFWPHCGANYNQIVSNAKIQPHQHKHQQLLHSQSLSQSQSQHHQNQLQQHQQQQQQPHPIKRQMKASSVEVPIQHHKPFSVKRQIKSSSVDVSNNVRVSASNATLIRSDSRRTTDLRTFNGDSRGHLINSYQQNDARNRVSLNKNNNFSRTSIRVEGNSRSRPSVTPLSTSTMSIYLGNCEMPITREREYHGSPTASGTSSGSGGRYLHSPSGEWTSSDGTRSRTSNNNNINKSNKNNNNCNISTKSNCTSSTTIPNANKSSSTETTTTSVAGAPAAVAAATITPTTTTIAARERIRSVSLPNILNISESQFETTTTNDGISVIGISSSNDVKRDLFSSTLQSQIRAVSSPSLSDHPLDANTRNNNHNEYKASGKDATHSLTSSSLSTTTATTTATNAVLVNGHRGGNTTSSSTTNGSAGVLQKFKRTFSNFNKQSNGGSNSSSNSSATASASAPSTNTVTTQSQLLQQIPVPVLEMSDNTAKYRFGPLIWRSSKERRKTKYNRRDKCNSGDSGIQIELENDETFAGMEINGASLTSTPKSRIRRANSAKATSSPTSALTAKAKALKKIESYDSRMVPTSLPARRSLSQPSGLDRVTRTDLDESDTDSVSSHPDCHEGQHRPMYAEVMHNFTPAGQQELALVRGNLVEILRKEVGPWWYGRIKSDAVVETLFEPQLGWFPKDFVRPIQFPESDGTFTYRQRKLTSPSLDDTLVAATCSISPNNVTTIVVDHPSPDASPKKIQLENACLRNNAIKELLETEINYVKLLGSLCNGYLPAMRKRIDIFSTESLNLIFSNIESIWKFQQSFLDSLKRGIEIDRIAQVFLRHQSGFLVYSTYCNSYPRALIELETYSRSKEAKVVLENCRQAENLAELPLSAHLLAPIQRICRYPLHLAELIKNSFNSTNENGDSIDEIDASLLDIVDSKEMLDAALKAMKKVTEAVNEGKRHSENLARHQSSFENFTGPPLHFHSTRYFTQIDATRVSPNLWNNTYTLFLFDHQLIYCKKDILKRNHFIYKGRIFLDNCRILNLPDGKIFGATVKNALRIYCESRNKWFDFSFRSANRKKRFLSTLALERQFCGKNLFISELAGEEDDNLSDREYHSDYEAMTTTTILTPTGENHYSSVQLNWKENIYDEKSPESPAKQQKYSDTLPKKSRQINSKEGYEYNTGSLGRRRIGNWFRKSKSTNSTPNQSPTHNPSVIIFNSDSSSQSSPALGKNKAKDSSGSSS
ncbi:uncharacterized protein LOC129946187 [Eupeodes corollae]|uniref:uncharacterized protein LOC129946187 n=1 Tax=Eupeodes corollae TaxID=290404 RepID=UPI0024918029|nr:uncharacterized protein LOC129946187 [Eupeodes corollae]